MSKKRSLGLILIVGYKFFVMVLMLVTAIALFFSFENYQGLQNFSESYRLESKYQLIDWLLDKVLKLSPKKLEFSAFAAVLYALITAIEALGLWQEKMWAELLVIGLVGVSIPFEIYELVQSITLLKLVIFIFNIFIIWYLIRQFKKTLVNSSKKVRNG